MKHALVFLILVLFAKMLLAQCTCSINMSFERAAGGCFGQSCGCTCSPDAINETWTQCTGWGCGSSDIEPGGNLSMNGVLPSHGSSFMSMTCGPSGEGHAITLCPGTSLSAGKTYCFAIDLISRQGNTSLGIYGSMSPCDNTQQLLWTSPVIPNNGAWSTHNFCITPTGNWTNISFRLLSGNGFATIGMDNWRSTDGQFPPKPTSGCAPTVTISGGNICEGDCFTLNAQTTGSAPFTYTWIPGMGSGSTMQVCPSQTTTYTIIVADSKGDTHSAWAAVWVNPLPTVTAAGSTICPGQTGILSASGAATYTWQPGNLNGSLITISATANSTYTVTGTSPAGCTGSSTAGITLASSPQVAFLPDTSGCVPLVVQFRNTTTGISNGVCVWDFGDGSPLENNCNPLHTYANPGIYSVKLKVGTAGCGDSLLRPNIITVYAPPVAGFTFDPPQGEMLEPMIRFTNTSSGDSIRTWNFGDGTLSNTNHPAHTYADTGLYTVCLSVQSTYGCTDSVCSEVMIKPAWSFYIPNAFSPNGDGKNETFNGKGENIYDYELLIFDRWGNLLFESNSIQRDWDGRADGGTTIAQEDVYVYVVKFTDLQKKKHRLTGSVVLVK